MMLVGALEVSGARPAPASVAPPLPDPWAEPPGISDYTPRSVEACRLGHESDGALGWVFAWINRATGEMGSSLFRCGSWRCPYCAPRVFSRDRGRLEVGLSAYPEWVAICLTFDRRAWRGAWSAFRGMYHAFGRFMKRLRRLYGEVRYLAVAERHRSGWPHLHVLLAGGRVVDAFRAASCKLGPLMRSGEVLAPSEPGWVRSVLRPMVTAAGFGRVVDGQALDGHAACAAYLTSSHVGLATNQARRAAELVGSPRRGGGKGYQSPLNAPPHFRRIRSSRGLVEPHKRPPGEAATLLAIIKRPRAAVEGRPAQDLETVILGAVNARRVTTARRQMAARGAERAQVYSESARDGPTSAKTPGGT